MSLPKCPYFDVASLAERWDVRPSEIIAWGVGGYIRLAIAMPLVETTPERQFSGLAEIDAAEAVRLFRVDPVDAIVVHRFRPIGKEDWERITQPAAGVRICRHDVIVTLHDVMAIEERPAVGAATAVTQTARELQPKARAGRPAGSSTHDWEAFHAQVTAIVHNQGVPKTMAELAGVMEKWFSDKDPENVPDLSTIRKKLRPTWDKLRPAA